ncbi:restriction endonuclease subunit S [Mycoplasmopsis bovis]|uniref:restriction endonuclease subunit S n=1 Tax=Mycoplasmopsis bovis TaxID=28903 RepID=UPI001E55D9E0
MMIASDVKKYGKFDVYDPNKIVGKTDAEPFRSDYISIVKDGDAGRIRLLPKNTMILSTMGALIAKDPFKIDFLYYMLNAINDLSRERNGSIIPHIYFKDYGQNIYNLPSIPEQSKISSLFTYLDSLITLHQRKLSSLKNLKNRLLDRMFCDEKSQFPSIRFTEFTNAWEQDTAKNLFIPYRVKNSSNMNLVSYSVTNKDGFVNQNEYFDDGGKAVFADKKNSLIVSINTFAYNPSRINVGSLALYKHSEMGLVSPIYEVFQINNNNNPDFFLLWFRSEAFKNIVSTNSNKSVRDTLNLSQFESESVNFPNFAEQSKISSLFTHLDSLITLHQRKLLSLKNLKSRLLDRMFCDEKSQFPSIRFKEFTNVWEQGKLGNLIDKGGSGGTPNTSNAKFYNGSIPFLTIADLTKADGHIYSTEKHITNEGLNSSSAWIVPKGSLTLSIYATIGKIGIMHQNMATSQAFYSMVINDDITKKYLYYHLKKSDVFGEWTKLISTGTQANLNSEKVKSFGIFIPKNKSEQSKISSLFTHLDSLITLHQRKLLSLKNLKSRLLDRMFCDEKSQFPSIRFKEFTNTWEQKKLRNVVSYHSSVMIASDVKKYGKFDVYDPNKIVGKTDAEPFRSDYISIVKDGDAGRIRLLPKNTMILSTMGALIAKDPFKIDFLYYMLNAINDLARERNGSIIPHIYFKDYGQNIYNLPSTPEQSKISSLFTRLDSLITLHQRG